jgi:hypothetical protein
MYRGYIKGIDRHQARIVCLDDRVAKGSRARLIDTFVDAIDLKGLGFAHLQAAAGPDTADSRLAGALQGRSIARR